MYNNLVEAWDRLDNEWQGYVRVIKQSYIHLIEEGHSPTFSADTARS